jgi:hypothetical protein
MKPFKVREDVLKTEVLFLLGMSAKEANEHLKSIGNKHLLNEEVKGVAGQLLMINNGMYRIVWSEKFSLTNIACVAHELFHLVVRILDDKGIHITVNDKCGYCGDEIGAYLLEFYLEKIKEQYARNNRQSGRGNSKRIPRPQKNKKH